MNRTVADCLYKGVVLLGYIAVEQADQAIITTRKQDVLPQGVKAHGRNLVVVFRILPHLLVLSGIPRKNR